MKHETPLRVVLVGLLLAGCQPHSLVDLWTPADGRPTVPADYKHGQPGERPEAPAAEWWKVFHDPVLDDLAGQVEAANPNAAAALARVDQAMATLGITRAELFPIVSGEGIAQTQREAPNNLLFPIENEYERYRLAANASWEIDLWGRLRGAYKRDRHRAEAAVAEYRDVLLSLQASVARQYFALRHVESEKAILKDAVHVRQEAVDLQQALSDRGAGTDVDVARARTELETTRADAEGRERTRGKLEHALAELTGRPPAELDVPAKPLRDSLPGIPAGLPSELLQRRPDLRAAESNLLAAAKQVGVTKAAFLPKLSLTGTGGLASLKATDLFSGGDSFFYTLGPQLDVPIFQGGTLSAGLKRSQAQWREALETYRGVLLTAVREVDDSLLDLQVLKRQIATQQRAVEEAARATSLAQKRFEQGVASYFEVVDAQRTELQARRTANALSGERAAATVQLIQALGGGW